MTMVNIYEDYEFPCGLKIISETTSGILDHLFGKTEGHFDLEDCICPLHGKDCKR